MLSNRTAHKRKLMCLIPCNITQGIKSARHCLQLLLGKANANLLSACKASTYIEELNYQNLIIHGCSSQCSKEHSGRFIWANPKISNTFSPIFPSFVHLLSTKPMILWSIAPGQFLGGQWVEHKAEF